MSPTTTLEQLFRFRVSAEELRMIEQLAEEAGLSMSATVKLALREYARRKGITPPKARPGKKES